MKNLPALLLLLALIQPATAGELPPIDQIMSDEELEMTGMNKLDAEELQALREWMAVFFERDARQVMRSYRKERRELEAQEKALAKERGEEPKKKAPRENRFETLKTTIDGEFSGWSGKTSFKLANGQVWQQRRSDSSRRIRTIQNPEVVIERNLLGFYVMKVPEARVNIPVQRIK